MIACMSECCEEALRSNGAPKERLRFAARHASASDALGGTCPNEKAEA
jgi:hypothetical protein